MAKKVTAKKSTAAPKKVVSKPAPKTASKPAAKKVSKAAPKTSVKTRTAVQSHAIDTSSKRKESSSASNVTKTNAAHAGQPKVKPFKLRKSYALFIIGIIALGALLYLGRSFFVAAVVNGQPISRISVIKETEKQSGKQALDTIVRNTLIEQEARKANISVSEKEVDEEIKKVEDTLSKQGQKIDDVLAMQGMTKQDLRKIIKLNKLVTKVVGDEIKISDAEVTQYLEKNKDLLPQDQSEEQLKKAATEQLKQQKLNDKIRTWLESLETKAKIMYFVQY